MLFNLDSQHFKSASAHNVLHEGAEIGGIILVQVKPQYASLPEVQQSMVPAMADAMAGSGAKVTLETIHTEKVAVTRRDSSDVYLWYHAGDITIVIGGSGKGPDIRGFVEAYLTAAHASGAPGTPTCGYRKPMPSGDIHESRPLRGHAAGPGTDRGLQRCRVAGAAARPG
jgi:hypothetical protein